MRRGCRNGYPKPCGLTIENHDFSKNTFIKTSFAKSDDVHTPNEAQDRNCRNGASKPCGLSIANWVFSKAMIYFC